MFIDHTQFDFLNKAVQNVDAIAREFENSAKNTDLLKGFLDPVNPTITHPVEYWIRDNKFHPDDLDGYIAIEGIWNGFPLYKMGFPINFYKVNDHFPSVVKVLKNVPGLNFSAFMRLDPGARSLPHKHLMKNWIFHLLLNDLDKECEFTVDGHVKSIQKKGDAILFPYSKEHSSINKSNNRRINFTIDFDPHLLTL